mgnify:CR=1 FL=1
MSKVTFSTNSMSNLICPEGKVRAIYYDKKQPKLACVVSVKGIKTFALHSWDRNIKKPIQHTIGRYPEVSVNQAREEVGKLLSRLTAGEDIKEAARSIREEPTLDDLFSGWLVHAKQHKRSWRDDEQRYSLHLKPTFGTARISAITTEQVRKWHSQLPTKGRQRSLDGEKTCLSQASANRCFALLKTVYNQGAPEIPNPCKNVKSFKEVSRDRFLRPEELKQFFAALNSDEVTQTTRDLILLLLFTGARRSNVLSMQWGELDLTQGTWIIPSSKSKNAESMHVPLVAQAVEILERRKREASSVFVFPGTGRTGHLMDPKKVWAALLKKAGLPDVRLHDLRRTCGSYQAACGSSLTVIGKSLGHKNVATTAIYSRLTLDPVRDSMEKGAAAMMVAVNAPEKVAKLEGGR